MSMMPSASGCNLVISMSTHTPDIAGTHSVTTSRLTPSSLVPCSHS
jgi:hypothetical protein